VHWGLREMGIPCDWWDRAQFPKSQLLSSWISVEEFHALVSESNLAVSPDRYRTIWNRRGQVPQTSAALDRTDKTVARNESIHVLGGLVSALTDANPAALFVNAFEDARAASPKIHQLNVARSVGFKIPRTLVSNHPDHIRQFFALNGGRIVAKQHIPFAWRTTSGVLLVTATSVVQREHLVRDAALHACPMIYQEMLSIRNELRIIAFGQSVFALDQIRTQAPTGRGFVDVRYEKVKQLAAVASDHVVELCHRYMSRMKLNYAAFDIAQLTDGEFVFLEANESGQFLFLEDQVPELPILDAFCQFLASGDAKFRYEKSAGLSLAVFNRTEEARQFQIRYEAHLSTSELTSPFELIESD
jgi:glutathione synthase/RimK-type ligase-like ATP-grasp enzyme